MRQIDFHLILLAQEQDFAFFVIKISTMNPLLAATTTIMDHAPDRPEDESTLSEKKKTAKTASRRTKPEL